MSKKTEMGWADNAVYEKVKKDVTNNWPNWKKQLYNEMFAVSAHAGKFSVKK